MVPRTRTVVCPSSPPFWGGGVAVLGCFAPPPPPPPPPLALEPASASPPSHRLVQDGLYGRGAHFATSRQR